MGCGSVMTCWRRTRDWQKAGVWENLHRILLAKLRNADRLDFSRVIADSSSCVPCMGGTGPNSTDRRKAGSKRHLVVDGNGAPLATIRRSSCHCPTGFLPSPGDVAGPCANQGACKRTVLTIASTIAVSCGSVASILSSPSAAPSMVATSGRRNFGESSAPTHSSISEGGRPNARLT